MAKDKKKNDPELSTDEALKRIFGKDAAKRLRAVADQLDTGKGKNKNKNKNKNKKKKR